MARRIVDLPAPLVPSSASTSPRLTSNPTSKSTCTGPYEKSTSATCSAGISVRRLLLAPVLRHLLPQLGDHEGEVVADEARTAQDQQPADDGRRDHDHDHRGARARTRR